MTWTLPMSLQDPRFNKQVDKLTGYKTKSILCMPILAPSCQVCCYYSTSLVGEII